MLLPQPTFLLAWLTGFAVIAGSLTAAAQDSVKIIVANADELMATGPDTSLAPDLLRALEETTLLHGQPMSAERGSVLDRTKALIALASPEVVNRTNQQGTTIEVSPVSDFDAFVTAIDYGDVVSRNDEERMVRVKIRPDEISEERVRTRLDKVDDESSTRLITMLLGDDSMGFTPAGRFGRDEEEAPVENQLGGSIAPDDYVEIDLGGQPYAARVLLTKREFNDDIASLVLLDKASLERAIPQRQLKKRVQQAESVSFWAPFDRLRKLPGPPAAKPIERTWTDATGKFKIVATFGGLDGENVRLKKTAGNEVKVPLAKLSDADRKYVEELEAAAVANANPFADQPVANTQGSVRADWSAVKQVRPKGSRKWSFTPPKTPAGAPAKLRVTTLEVGRPTDIGPFGEEIEDLYIADDGSSAVVVISVGHGPDEKRFVQRLDFAAGTSESLLQLPVKSKVLDIDPAQRIVLLGAGDFVSNSSKVYVHRMEADQLVAVCDWDALPPKSHFKGLTGARVIGKGRVATQTQFGPWVVWGASNGKAEYLIELEGSSDKTVKLAYGRRLMVANGGKAVQFIDLVSGKHLASLPHGAPSLDNITVNPALTRLAIVYDQLAGVLDLSTGKFVQGLQGGLLQRAKIDFMGDLLLVDSQYLVEPTYPVLLWEYAMARETGDDSHATVVADRLWYAVRNRSFNTSDKGPWNVTTIPAPHDAVKNRLAKLGDLDSLVILNEGDEVSVEVDTDLDAETAKKLKESLVKAITEAGYKVVQSAAEKQVIAVCKAAKEPIEVLIADPDAKPPENRPLAGQIPMGHGGPLDNWRMTRRTVTPYDNVIVLRRNGKTLWSDAALVQAGRRFYPIGDEKVDDVVKRIETADPERLLAVQLPGRMCRRGDATPMGAYGASLLDAEGVVEDKMGEAVSD